jgi:hypothetical protein
MNCEEFVLQSEEWMEGHRAAEASEHAKACESCRCLVEDFDAIRLVAPQLAMSAAPPANLWESIRARLEQEGLIRPVMTCEEFANQTEEWMEGRRSPEAREHAMACEACRAYVEDLDAIRLVAPQLALNEEPPERLWKAIRAQVAKEGLIREPAWPARAFKWAFVYNGPLAAVAAGLALALLTFSVTAPRLRPPVRTSGHVWLSANEAELANIDTQLNHVERSTMRSVRPADPAVQETLRQNLVIVDRQIARCEKTLEQAPSDENTRDYLYDAYRQKADLLNMMAANSTLPTE